LNSKANALLFIGRYDEAITMHQQVIQKFPKYYVGHKDLGLAYQAIGRCGKARNAFRRYLQTAPEGSLALGHILLARLYLLLEDPADAMREAETALALDSLSLEARCLKGCVAIRLLGDTERAKAELAAMEHLLADSDLLEDVHHYHYLHGLILLADNRFNEGLDVLRNEIETAPRDYSIFLRKELIRGFIAADRTEEAMREAALLLALTPNDGELHYLIGLSRRAAGETGPAERHFKVAMRTWKDADSGFPPLARLISQLER
jgi:tetratricopeptide (TPR) repeat protein